MYDVEEVKKGVNILEIARSYTHMKRSGKEWVGCCPIHNEKTPSFYVNEHKNLFHCFGCGAGGDVIDLVRKSSNIDFKEAVEKLGGQFTERVYISPVQFVKPVAGVVDRESVEHITDPKFYKHNPLFIALCEYFPAVDVQGVFQMYHIGTTRNTRGNDNKISTVFYQRSVDGNYNVGVKTHYIGLRRCKETRPQHIKPKDGATEYILFGEHLLMHSDNVFIVESEKTAVIMTLAGRCIPEFEWASKGVWMATTGQQKLDSNILLNIKRKAIVLVPDKDAVLDKPSKSGGIIEGWATKAERLDKEGFCISVYDCKDLTDKQDIADIVI